LSGRKKRGVVEMKTHAPKARSARPAAEVDASGIAVMVKAPLENDVV